MEALVRFGLAEAVEVEAAVEFHRAPSEAANGPAVEDLRR
jgi:hypothetical protein